MKNQPVSEKINYCVRAEITNMTMVMDLINKHILLKDEALDWIQIWTAASFLDVKAIIV